MNFNLYHLNKKIVKSIKTIKLSKNNIQRRLYVAKLKPALELGVKS